MKSLEALKEIVDYAIVKFADSENKYQKDLETIEKDLKALEIIKEKQINVSALLELDDLQQHNDYCDMVGGCKKLTQEEYDLLKEVLQNG